MKLFYIVLSFIATAFGGGMILGAVAFTAGGVGAPVVVRRKAGFGCITKAVGKLIPLHGPQKGRAKKKECSISVPLRRVRLSSEPMELEFAPLPQNLAAGEKTPSSPVKEIAPETINAVTLGTLVLAAAYGMLHNDMAKLAALPDNVDHFKAAFSMLKNLPTEWLAWYDDEALSNPLSTKATTSGVCYFLGDLCAQGLAGKDLGTIRVDRAARSAAAGFIGHGPIAHYWLGFLDAHFSFGGAWWAVVPKIMLDQGPMSIVYNTIYSLLLGAFAFRNPREVLRDVQAAFVPGFLASIRFWPAVHLVTFSAIPVELQLLWIDIAEIIWVCILSRVNNEGIREDNKQEEEASVLR